MTKALLVLLALGCPSLAARAQTTTVSLLHFNDLHAHLTPHKDLVRHGNACAPDANATTSIGERGGLARLKTLVTQLRAANPNSILLNVGDTYHGGVEAAYTSGNAIVAPVEALGIDGAVPGNWDFAYGPGVFRKRYTPGGPFPQLLNAFLPPYPVQAIGYPVIAANLTYKKLGPQDASVNNALVLPATREITRGGIKIGFIGLTSDIVPAMYAQLATGFNFFTGEAYYTSLLNAQAATLRANGCKLVCVLSELGVQKDYRLSQLVAAGQVDVFFSGHTHELTVQPLQFGPATPLVVEAGNDAWLGKMDVTFDNAGNVLAKQWSVRSIDTGLAADPAMLALVNAARAPFLVADPNLTDPMGTSAQALHRPVTAVAGYTNRLLTRNNALESSFNDALSDIMKAKARTQLAITPGFRFDSPVASAGFQYEDQTVATGAITVEDIYRFYPVFYTLATAQVTGDTLRHIVEKLQTKVFSRNAFNQEGGWVDGFAGLDASLNLTNADNARVTQLYYAGTTTPIGGTDVLTVVGCIRPNENAAVLCSHTGFFNRTNFINPATSQPYTAIQLLEEYLTTAAVPAAGPAHFTDAGNLPQWVSSPFVQPVYNATCAGSAPLAAGVPAAGARFSVFPNPTRGLLTVVAPADGGRTGSIRLYNGLGQLVQARAATGTPVELDLSAHPAGIYFIRVSVGTENSTYKVIRQ